MSDTSIEARIAALEGRITDLERQRWEGPPRIGPKPPSSEQMAEHLEPPPVDRSKVCTTSGEPADKVRAEQTEETGQHKGYIVLCEDERKKGFVRPYRDSYTHIGRLQEMTNDANEDFTIRVGGCNTVTKMGRALSETYARDPKFYGATFCCGCNKHLPVSEFVWTADGETVGS